MKKSQKTLSLVLFSVLFLFILSFASFADSVSVYLPHSYAISGWVIVVHKDQIKPAEGFTAKQAMEFAVSGGTVGVRSEKRTVKSEES